ncbi:MAG: hypothetical protein WCC86_04940 [Methanoregula sp.]
MQPGLDPVRMCRQDILHHILRLYGGCSVKVSAVLNILPSKEKGQPADE